MSAWVLSCIHERPLIFSRHEISTPRCLAHVVVWLCHDHQGFSRRESSHLHGASVGAPCGDGELSDASARRNEILQPDMFRITTEQNHTSLLISRVQPSGPFTLLLSPFVEMVFTEVHRVTCWWSLATARSSAHKSILMPPSRSLVDVGSSRSPASTSHSLRPLQHAPRHHLSNRQTPSLRADACTPETVQTDR